MIIPTDFHSGWLRLGALIVMLSIAADALNQQLIQYKQRVVYSKDSSTTINRAGRYTRGSKSSLATTYIPGKLHKYLF